MRYMVWGIGSATMFFFSVTKQYFRENEVVAFVDNDPNKWNQQVTFGTLSGRVISPREIVNYVYDKIIICSSYEDEIKQKIVEELGISEEKIVNRQVMVDDIIIPAYEAKYALSSDTKILLVGNRKAYENISAICEDIFTVQGFVDEQYLDDVKSYEYDYILLTGDFLSRDNLYTAEQLIEKLVQFCKVSYKKILTYDIYDIYRMKGREVSYGKEHKDKKFMLIKPGRWTQGLATTVLFVARKTKEARQRGYIPIVDMMSYKNQYLEQHEIGKVNAWEKFFRQPDGYTLDDIKKSQYIRYEFWKGFSNIALNKEDMPVMRRELQIKAQTFKKIMLRGGQKVLGVLFRGTDYANLKPRRHPIQPDLEMMLNTIKQKEEEWGKFDKIYVCTEVKEAIARFESEFLDRVIYYPQVRFSSSLSTTIAETVIERENDAFLRGADYWVALECLAACDALIAGNCGGTWAAVALNDGKYEHQYIFDLGRYE